MTSASPANYDLKEEIRDYWSKRSETFDRAFGHHIPEGPEFEAWAGAIRDHLGTEPLRVLDLACGTGEITKLLLALGHDVTALDFSEAMLAVARRKHAGRQRLRFRLGDAENTMEPENAYDAIVCRHLVWTLTEPQKAFADWHRVLKPGGRLLFFDGDWARPTRTGRLASGLIALIDRLGGADPFYDGAMGERHARIMERLPFGRGLRSTDLLPLLEQAGFRDVVVSSHRPIAAAQRRRADLRNRLRTYLYRRFIICCRK
ncbi:class I SAM-dependent methyltransferase [Labrys sp. ZIDIC5]|uniref:class I SAM-dependent methyltransferase n=1 Tax=Labrys sedimenti TaxID=3106036 RepID=UPI002ACA5659|nr:class I SAM-dependent methyltransferase [Labrys sp. ZIDIC5]MDZ5449998.1 class I SAM-dependent methyltransferase [Labrys sp. ZIDIC5]